MTAQTGIVILNYGQKEYTVQCLHALKKQTARDFAVIVMDNSPDGKEMTEEDVKAVDENFIFRRLHENRGFSAGNNPAIRYFLDKGCKYVWLLNNDTVPAENAVELSVDFMKKHPETGVAGMKLVSPEPEKSLLSYGGGFFDREKIFTTPCFEPDRECDWICGCSMLVRREVFEKTGLLDEKFFLFFEDVDFTVRARNNGFGIATIPQVEIIHYGGRSQSGSAAARHCRKSAFLFAKKHSDHPLVSYLWIIETRILAPFVKKLFSLDKNS